jgi:hypothetical protein
MAVVARSADPSGLLAAIRLAILEGKIETWSVDSDGDFTHNVEQWRFKAWFRPVVGADSIIFRIITPKATHMTTVTYAIYHGRFIEMLLAHCDRRFGIAWATAMPAHGDLTKA